MQQLRDGNHTLLSYRYRHIGEFATELHWFVPDIKGGGGFPGQGIAACLAFIPRLRMAMANRSFRLRTIHSTIGDLPVPPTARLPTQMMGRLKDVEGSSRLSKNQFRI
jgi:hypothetical protein